MPKRLDIKKILVIGSGPIVIGQACEFDYSGTQACKALREEGFEVVLVNSNPATIMTDPEFSDRTYLEPLHAEAITRIIERERPDVLLPTLGGQTSLNLAVELAEKGVLEQYNVELIGAKLDTIQVAEDRKLFRDAMKEIGMNVPAGGCAHTLEEAEELVARIGFPFIIRPAYTLGGIGGSVVYNREELAQAIQWGLSSSPVSEVLIEQSVLGWKEYELEIMRDYADNFVVVCSIENLDPMGIHTGDSVTVAPAQTLTDAEYQALRDAAKKIVRRVGVETGGANIQFAVNPQDGEMVVIEMNPRVSRSSALASKATGFPIARIAAKLATGYRLDEITNDITRKTPACFEPAIDYVVVKIPRWDFEKFPGNDRRLTSQMKSVGEAMGIGRTFKEALNKTLRSLENGWSGFHALGNADYDQMTRDALIDDLRFGTPDRLLKLWRAFTMGMSPSELSEITKIDMWFLTNLHQIFEFEQRFAAAAKSSETLDPGLLRQAKRLGFSDRHLGMLTGRSELDIRAIRKAAGIVPSYKIVDTCAAEFDSFTPYYYSTYDQENESIPSSKRRVIILGGGPNRIGQGIEFDYCCVHGVLALRSLGIEAIMVNCNPETVSTDYDVADKLYFEPLTYEDVLNIIELEKPEGVIIQFGGQTPLKLALSLEKAGVPIWGTSPDSIDLAEDRDRFGALLRTLGIPHPQYGTARSLTEAVEVGRRIGFPLVVRPSYVLGGRAMEIVYDELSLEHYMTHAVSASQEHPVLLDRFLEDAFEFDVDAICDGDRMEICGMMQHIEEAGIHSGDSMAVMPPYLLSMSQHEDLKEYTRLLAQALHVKGLLNIQYAIIYDTIHVLEVNPRASRTVPYVAVKESVFPFDRFEKADIFLRPEMRSTGEVMGISNSFGASVFKAFQATNISIPESGTAFISVNASDRNRMLPIAQGLHRLGWKLVATAGNTEFLSTRGLPVRSVLKVTEGRPNIVDEIKNGSIDLIINTPLGQRSRADEYTIGWAAIKNRVAFITTLSAAEAILRGLKMCRQNPLEYHCLQEYYSRVWQQQ